MSESVPSALVTAGVAYARRDYEAAEAAVMEALGGIRKERSLYRRDHEVRVYAE